MMLERNSIDWAAAWSALHDLIAARGWPAVDFSDWQYMGSDETGHSFRIRAEHATDRVQRTAWVSWRGKANTSPDWPQHVARVS